MNIAREEIAKLPFVRHTPSDGRIVQLQSWYDAAADDWHLYIPHEERLIRMQGGEAVLGTYYAKEPANPATDIEFRLGRLILQHLSFPEIVKPLHDIQSDIHNCAAVLEKYHVFWHTRNELAARSAALLVQSELEYLFFLLRSLYDGLQHLVTGICSRLIALDGSNRKVCENLPNSFRRMVLKDDRLQSVSEIQARWHIPAQLAQWYEQEAEMFCSASIASRWHRTQRRTPIDNFRFGRGTRIGYSRGTVAALRTVAGRPNPDKRVGLGACSVRSVYHAHDPCHVEARSRNRIKCQAA